MKKDKVYKIPDLIKIIFQCAPFYVVFRIIIIFMGALIPAAQTMATADFVDSVKGYMEKSVDMVSVVMAVLLIIAYIFLSNLIPAIEEIIDTLGRQKLDLYLNEKLVRKRSRLSYECVENKECMEVVNRVCEEPTTNFMNGYINFLGICQLLVTTISILTIIASVSIWAGVLIILVGIPFLHFAMQSGKSNYTMMKEERELQRRYEYLGGILADREHAYERKLFGFSGTVNQKYDALCDKSYQIEKKIQIKGFINLKSGSVISLFLAIVIIGIQLPLFRSGRLTLGLMIALTTAILNLVQSMSWQLSDSMFAFAQTKEYLKDFTVLMNLDEKKDAAVLPDESEPIVLHTLEFENVSFCYPGTQRWILKNCSFQMTEGESCAFVGENGAGKTTIVKLLLGLYENYSGRILINGIELKDYSYGRIKRLISAVSQDFARYELTIKENVFLGNVLKEDEALMYKSLEKSGLLERVEKLPQGADTRLGKIVRDGIDFSGGEWQRLAIARLLYGEAAINILDEPTAALDPVQESRVYEMFRDINNDSSVIYITHRLGAARVADKIMVLADGHIAECGDHDTLMAMQDGIYKKMFEAQKSWYE